jgi:hypothetical protein
MLQYRLSSTAALGMLAVIVPPALAQVDGGSSTVPRFRTPNSGNSQFQSTSSKSATGPAAKVPTTPVASRSATHSATTTTSAVLERSAGQVWREYDISPYTSKVKSTARPEQAIVDWVLRETGTEVWFSEPLGLLSASKDKLRVYHTPEMQKIVADVVDRFVSAESEAHVLSLRLVTVGSPNWRSVGHHLLQPVSVQTPGVDAWLLTKENAAVLLAQLSKRNDYQEHNSPNLLIHNGQSQTLSRIRPRNYVRGVRLRENTLAGYELEMGQVDEGYSLELSPLISADNKTIDAVIRCHVDQVESLVPVSIDVPSYNTQRQRVQIQVPQIASWRLHERFRWPADHVLLISAGVGATPSAERPKILGIPNLLATGPPRADGLLFIESKGKASQSVVEAARNARHEGYHGRY